MNVFEFRKSKAGMTLVEMVISLVIMSILMTSTMGLIISSSKMFTSASKAAIDRQVGNAVYGLLERTMRYSTHLSIYNSEESAKTVHAQYFAVNETNEENNAGTIKYRNKNGDVIESLYDPSFYGDRTVQYSVKEVGTGHRQVQITVKVFREGRQVYNHTAKVKCLNLSLVTVGNNANAIIDKSDDDAVNQFITFSVDEKLMSGGENAFSLEFNVNDFINQYNLIQSEYTSLLNQLYGNYSQDCTTSYGVNGTSPAVTSPTKRIQNSDYQKRTKQLYECIFGKATEDKGIISNIYDNPRTGSSTTKKGTITTATDVYSCSNLRQYYQEKIYDLLGFVPTDAFNVLDNNGNINTTETRKIAGSWTTDPVTGASYHTGNPYYGVVATKEELYLGFMLKYYDDNNDKAISKSEYPSFTNEDTFFAGTTIQSYMKNTNTEDSKNKMIIMAYFKDNVADNYSELITSNEINVYTYVKAATSSNRYAKSIWKHSSTSIDLQNLSKLESDETEATSSVTSSDFLSIDTNRYTTSARAIPYENGTFYQNYKVNTAATSTSPGNYTGDQSQLSKYKKGTELANSIKNTMGSNLTIINSNGNENGTSGDYYFNESSEHLIYIVPHADMKEGWYCYIASNKQWHFFYLRANANCNTNKIAVKAVSEGTSNSEANARIVLEINYKVTAPTYWSYCKNITYAQAQYISDTVSNPKETKTTLKTFTAHQFTDYMIYGVDWNSWFVEGESGIINKIAGRATDFVDTVVKTFTGESKIARYNIDDNANKNNKITPEKARFSLGNSSKFNLSNGSSTSVSARSYNMAQTIYNTKRGTWYYLPSSSTRISTAASKIQIVSGKDMPTLIDVEFNNGKTWRNSTAVIYDIDRGKMSSSGLAGIVDTTSDVVWTALPTGNTVEIDTD